jgi:hypothetical protein
MVELKLYRRKIRSSSVKSGAQCFEALATVIGHHPTSNDVSLT